MNSWKDLQMSLIKGSKIWSDAGLKLVKKLFSEKTVMLVSKQKIRTFKITPALQAATLCFIVAGVTYFTYSAQYVRLMRVKTQEISQLKASNEYFQGEFIKMNEKLKYINNYLIITTGAGNRVNSVTSDESPETKKQKELKRGDISKSDLLTIDKINKDEALFAQANSIVENRVRKVESALSMTGLSVKKTLSKNKIISEIEKLTKSYAKLNSSNGGQEILLNDPNELMKHQGGPYIKLADHNKQSGAHNQLDLEESDYDFFEHLNHLVTLESLVKVLPLKRPMDNYYISSGFGTRIDPITKELLVHRGIDFVGSNNKKIVSPSFGKVVLAKRFNSYGNAVIIDHGFGITTRYGHLSKIVVHEGQMIRTGEMIGMQGSTGRSTGNHLHYEIRYKDAPLDPRKFLAAGTIIFGNSEIRHAL